MKRRLIIAAYIIIGVVLFKLAFSYGYNEWVISKYEEEDYSENFNLLEVANVNEPYIAYYNNGNVMYRLEDYRRAIEYYEKALEYVLPEGKECPIRINLALAKLALMDPDYMAREHIDESLEIMQECLDILSEENCANDYGYGHNNRAQRLYDEIKDLMEETKKEKEKQDQQKESEQETSDESQDESDSSESNSNPNQSDKDKKKSRKKQIQDEMQRRMSDANKQRQFDRKRSRMQDEDWIWEYDEQPVW